MKGDRPTTRRMGFGPKQAFEAHVPIVLPRSGAAMADEVRERRASERLREMIAADEKLGPVVARMIQDQHLSAQSILAELESDGPAGSDGAAIES